VIRETFGRKSLSMIGGLALYRFHFQIHSGTTAGCGVANPARTNP
jgi:hypothetical protein